MRFPPWIGSVRSSANRLRGPAPARNADPDLQMDNRKSSERRRGRINAIRHPARTSGCADTPQATLRPASRSRWHFPARPFLRLALSDLCPRRRVSLIFPSTGVRTEAANPHPRCLQSPEPRNQRIECSVIAFPRTAIVDHPRRGFSAWPAWCPVDFLS
jgi:hypothetical protein